MALHIIDATFLLLFLATSATARFNFFVRVHSYDNPTNRCATCRTDPIDPLGCCDKFSVFGECSGVDRCDNSFRYCLRIFGTPSNIDSCVPFSYISRVNTDGELIDFSRSSALGLPNPLSYERLFGPWIGLQVYLEVCDIDSRPPNEIVDTFSIDVEQIPLGEETSPQVFNGTFGFAYIEMSFKVECSISHYFPNCDTSCVQEGNCTCLPGYTGAQCQLEIDECAATKNCSGNGKCTDKVNAFECTCFPGYTGALCEIEINECIGVDCSGNGECIDEVNDFECNCSSGYTGALCEMENECIILKKNCSGNGECKDKINGSECSCFLGYTGALCEVNINDCNGVNCSGNGECMDRVAAFECNCSQGYNGDLCEVNITDCIGVDCSSSNGSSSTEVVTPEPISDSHLETGLGIVGAVVLVLVIGLVVLLTAIVVRKHRREKEKYEIPPPRIDPPRPSLSEVYPRPVSPLIQGHPPLPPLPPPWNQTHNRNKDQTQRPSMDNQTARDII